MATLAEVWAALFPAALAPTAPTPEQLAREVAWVRVLKARVPAFDALDAGDLAIVPASVLAVVAPDRAESTVLAEALAMAGVAAVVLIDPERPPGTPLDLLQEALAAAGIATFRVVRSDPILLERAVIGYLVNRRAELEHQAAQLEATLEELALGDADLPALVAAIAGFLGRAVALEAASGHVVAAHAPPEAPGAPAAVAAYLGGTRTAALRVPLPGAATAEEAATDEAGGQAGAGQAAAAAETPAGPRAGGDKTQPAGPSTDSAAARSRRPGRPGGRLVILGRRPATELERVVGTRIARLLALELARDEAVRRAADQSRRGEQLPAAGPPWVVLMARQIHPGRATSTAQREEQRTRLRMLAPVRRLAFRGDAESLELRLVVALTPADPAGTELAGQAAALLGRVVAVSRPFEDPLGRPVAEAEARATLEAAESLADPPAVAQADRLAAYRLLTVLHALPDGQRHARALLGPLLVGSPEAQRERLATVRAVLEHPGFSEAAASLGVHRNTIAYRIHRIEQLSGWRLADPEMRIPLLVALELVQLD